MKAIQDSTETWNPTLEPLVDYGTLTAYERLNDAVAVSRAVFTLENESVLVRNSFRWKKDGEAIPDAPSAMSLEQVCEERGWKIVERYGEHLAVVIPE